MTNKADKDIKALKRSIADLREKQVVLERNVDSLYENLADLCNTVEILDCRTKEHVYKTSLAQKIRGRLLKVKE